MWLVSAAVALAAPDPAALAGAWRGAADDVAAHGAVPVALAQDDFAELARGAVVAHRADAPDGAYATGAVWLPVPVELAWVAVQDPAHRPIGRAAAEERLPSEPSRRRVYLKLALPWPLADRQWVAELTNNRALYDASGGRIWQRRWQLADPSLAPAPDPDAVWVEENQGAWTLVPA